MKISAFFIKRPVATALLMIAILVVGGASYPFLAIAPIPQVDFPTISVNASLPGASPETVATTVAQPLEKAFSQIPSITDMTSTSVQGSTSITLQFDLDRNLDGAAQDVQAAITSALATLPRNMPAPPRYEKTNPSEGPILGFSYTSEVMPMTEMSDIVQNIVVQQITQLPGIGNVNIGGNQKPSIRVQIDPLKLAATGLSLEDVRATLAIASTDSPKGSIDVESKSFQIYGNDQLTKAEEYNDIILAYRNEAPIRVRDVGVAVLAAENKKSAAFDTKGRRALSTYVNRQPGANIVETADGVKAAVGRLNAFLPPSVKPYLFTDRTEVIRASVAEIRTTLLITAVLVILVTFVFLRNLRATILPACAIPLSLIGTCAGMYLFNYTLDNLSLMALAIAVGFVVDDAIVMLENIYRHIENGETPMNAALKGAGEVGLTIVTMSVSLVAVFIPLLLMSGVVGRMFHEFAMTVSMTILISAVVSLTLTPMLAARILHKEDHQHGALYKAVEHGFDRLFGFYQRTLDIALRHQRAVFIVFVATVVATVGLYIVVPKGFFPQQDNGNIQAQIDGAQDASFAEMVKRIEEVRQIIITDPDVTDAVSALAMFGNQTPNNARISISLKPRNERDHTSQEVIDRLRPKLAGLEGARVFMQANQDIRLGGRGSRTQYQYTLQDVDAAELAEWSDKILARIGSLPQLRDLATDKQTGASTAMLIIDRDAAARYGIQPQLIDDTLYDAFGQRQVGQYSTQVNSYKIILEVLPEFQDNLRTLDRLYVKSPLSGAQVPLSTFVKVDTGKVSSLSVNHQGQFPAVTLSFNLAAGFALGEAVDAINQAQAEMGVPAGVRGTFQGAAGAFQDSLRTQPYLIAAAVLAVYIILGMLYESFIYPLAILSTLPSAGVGALLILLLTHYEFSVIALIGVILLIGLIKKNGIMMVDVAIKLQRDQGKPSLEAIREACLLRFRPIMMTSSAALLGGLPLMLASGAGSELRRPLGLAMVGGLIVSQMLTLYTTPIVFLYLERWRTRRTARGDMTAEPTPAE